jgi:hypothetical protein
MNATVKKGFHDPMEFVRGAADTPPAAAAPAPAVEPARSSVSANEPLARTKTADPVKAPEPAAPVAKPPVAAVPAPVPQIPSRRAPPTRPANVRIPEALHEELRQFWKDTDIPMSEVIIEGTRQRLAELKKQYGME